MLRQAQHEWKILHNFRVKSVRPETVERQIHVLSPHFKKETYSAWVTGGPVVLIQATSSTGETVKSRFDMQKSMFIDPLPVKTKKADIQHLVEALNAATDTSNW